MQEEEKWLSQNATESERNTILQILREFRPQQTLIKAGITDINEESFSTLCCERYTNNFLIDGYLYHIVKENGGNSINSKVISLPSQCLIWVKQNSTFLQRKLQEYLHPMDLKVIEIFLLPVNIDNWHWGLLVIDVKSETLYFDDGLKVPPPATLKEDTKVLLDALAQVNNFPIKSLRSCFWRNEINFRRFNMPQQPATGVGSSSCGVGVILAGEDIARGNMVMSWNFTNMGHFRKYLLSKMVCWMKL